MKTIFSVVISISISLFFVPAVSAQVYLSGGTYNQNFDSLANSGTANTWTDNSTLPGWYASKSVSPNAVSLYRAGTGSDTAGAIYSFGSSGSTERALGSIASGTPGNFAYGARFLNDTGLEVTNIQVSYTGEQWRNGGNATAHTLAFSYRISNSAITDSDVLNTAFWTSVSALNFITPTVGTTPAALDGNSAANRTSLSALLNGVILFPDQELFIRWFDPNDSGNDHALAVDDLSVNFITIAPVTNAPSIPPQGQPQSRTNNAGTVATFTVNANGSAPDYRWRKDGNDLFDGGNISGAGTPTLVISNLLAADAADYTVFVSNGAGSDTSSPAKLTVIDPAINAQPLDQTIVEGDIGNFFVGADGTVLLSYQWSHDGTDIQSAIYSSLNVGPALASDQGSYTVVVTSGTGLSVTSSPATLTLLSTPANRLARWDFNSTNTLTVTAPSPSFGSGTAALAGGTTADFNGGSFVDPAGPPSSLNSGWTTTTYPAQGAGNKNAGARFNVSTVGYQDILLTWMERHSPASSKYMRVQYSTDGVNFTDGDVITISTDSTFQFFSSNLSGIPGVSDNPNFAFRFVSEWESTAINNNNPNYVAAASGSSYNTGGTVRYDLVTVFANNLGSVVTPIPLTVTKLSNRVVLSWSDPSFSLQAAPLVTGTYTNVPGAASPYTNDVSGKTKFFRLIH